MSQEDQFWVNVWRAVGATLVCLAAVIAGCSAHKARVIESMVSKGADPMRAACAFGMDSSTQAAACVVLATKEK